MTQVILDARVKWFDTRMNLVAGQETLISSTGSNGQPWRGAFSGPDGAPTVRWPLSEVPEAYFCMLAGRIGTGGTPFGIGSGLAFTPAVSGRLYLIMNDGVNFGDNLGGFNVKVTQGGAQAIPAIIRDLARYGITVYQSGLSASDPNVASQRAWTFAELSEILRGVQYVARALYEAKYPIQTIVADNRIQGFFNQVMGAFEIRRVQNGYLLPGTDGCNGSANIACTSVGQNTIVFYGNVNVSQYTLVHELGHFFNNRSDMGGAATVSLHARMADASVNDNGSPATFLFGQRGTNWERGKRGWGSGPSSPTDFQQNAYEVDDTRVPVGSVERFTEIDEATADMFLNWVYSVVTDRKLGFQNISWLGAGCQTAAGCKQETERPGDARFEWMRGQMSEIFSQHPDWQAV